jgi:hypothetical protein
MKTTEITIKRAGTGVLTLIASLLTVASGWGALLPSIYYTYEFDNNSIVPVQVSFIDELPTGLVWNTGFVPLIQNPVGSLLGGSDLDELLANVTFEAGNLNAVIDQLRIPPGKSTLTLCTLPTNLTGTIENDATIAFGNGTTVTITATATISIAEPPVPDAPCLVILDKNALNDKTASVKVAATAHGVDEKWLVNLDSCTQIGNPWLNWSQSHAGDLAIIPVQDVNANWFQLPLVNAWSTEDFVDGVIPQNQLDKIPNVQQLLPSQVSDLIGKLVVAVVYDEDVKMDNGGLVGLKGNRMGRLAFTVLAVDADGVHVRIEPPVTGEVPVPCCSEPGLDGGHIDVDTSTSIAKIGSGTTDVHVHAYDDKNNVKELDFLNLLSGLKSLNGVVSDSQRFKIIIANADLSIGARLVVNSEYSETNSTSYVMGTEWDDTALSALPVYTLGGQPGTVKLETFKLQFLKDAILSGGLLPTTTLDVKANTPGKNGEWRNGAFTIQAVKVNADGTNAFTTSTSLSNGGVQGVATSGLLWEATVFQHWDGVSYHEAGNTFVAGVAPVE